MGLESVLLCGESVFWLFKRKHATRHFTKIYFLLVPPNESHIIKSQHFKATFKTNTKIFTTTERVLRTQSRRYI